MTFSFDDALTSARDRIRDLVNDTDPDSYLLSDESIDVYLTGAMAQTSETLAAACCLEKMAARVVGRAMSISSGGDSTNWGDVAKRYRDQAAALRAADAAGDGSGLFDIAEWAVSPFAAREILANDVLRSTG